MQHEIQFSPAYSLAIVKLDAGEELQMESGAMVSMSSGIAITTEATGGIFAGLTRSVLGGESFFLNTFTAKEPGEVTLAPVLPGDIVHRQMNGETLFVQSGSYLASSPSIKIDTSWGGAKTFFGGEGLFLLKLTGTGDLFISSYGAIRELDLAAGQVYTIDSGHMVSFAEGVTYEVHRAGGNWATTLLGGEGLVVEFTGPGRLQMQTRSQQGFVNWLIPQLPQRGND
jgi:uncharacterized protein (TIGR00266 family)